MESDRALERPAAQPAVPNTTQQILSTHPRSSQPRRSPTLSCSPDEARSTDENGVVDRPGR